MKNLFKITTFILTLITSVSIAGAVWVGPEAQAPGSNISAPVNTSGVSQIKSGGISVGSLIVSGGATLGDTLAECSATTTGTMRFNGGLLQICSNTPQLSATGTITTKDPLVPPSCLNGQAAVYTATGWECNPVPQTLPSCVDGDALFFSTSTYLWECGSYEGGKFQDATDPKNAYYGDGDVGIGTSDPEALLHVNSTNDANYSSTDHAATFGQQAGNNITIGSNEILARNNGSAADLNLQADGQAVVFRENLSTDNEFRVTHSGVVNIGDDNPWAENGKLVINNTTNRGPNNWYTSIKFTNGSHNAIWNPTGGTFFGLHSNGTFYWGDENGGTFEKYVARLLSDSGNLYLSEGSVTNSGDTYVDSGVVNFGSGNQRLILGGGNTATLSSLGTNAGLRLYDKEGTLAGTVWADGSNSFGLLDSDGNWTFRVVHDTDIRFLVNNSEKMRIEDSGAVGIGTTNPVDDYKLDVYDNTSGYMTRIKNTNTAAGADLVRIRLNVPAPSAYGQWMRFDSAGTARGFIRGNGNGVNYLITSDARLKRYVEKLNDVYAINLIANSKPVTFDWKETGLNDFGYIAQDLKKVIPIAVKGSEDDTEIVHKADGDLTKITKYMSVSMDTLVPILHGGMNYIFDKTNEIERSLQSLDYTRIEEDLNERQHQIDDLITKINK